MNIRNLMALIMVTTGLFAQSVMGTVFDANSRPLEGANVVLVGTDLGDTANEAGAYAMINVPAGTYDLTASFIGYSPITKSIVVGSIFFFAIKSFAAFIAKNDDPSSLPFNILLSLIPVRETIH